MNLFSAFAIKVWEICLEAAPWFALGLAVAAIVKVWVPDRLLMRWLGGRGFWPIFRAALIGTPLPLCSCGVLPAAMGLRRAGASRGATVSFLVATPENGIDSIAVSYAMLGPFMTIARPVAAIFSACLAGLLAEIAPRPPVQLALATATKDASCCESGSCHPKSSPDTRRSAPWPMQLVLAAADIMDDLAVWMGIGLLAAAAISTFVPPESLAHWGSGLPAMLAILVVAVPMYICATSSTPIAAALILAGVSPGTALVFMLAGPASNFSSIVVLRKELGTATVVAYLIGICVGAVSMGLLTDWVITRFNINVVAEAKTTTEWIPTWAATSIAVMIFLFAIPSFRHRVFRSAAQKSQSPDSISIIAAPPQVPGSAASTTGDSRD